jgi:hypothetical protein
VRIRRSPGFFSFFENRVRVLPFIKIEKQIPS